MFTGEQTQKMDTKGRTVIPSKIRDNLAERLVVTRGIDKCLFAYPETTWKALQEKLSSLPFTDKKVRSFNRFFLGGAEALDADKQGRVLVPSTFRDYASLTSQVVWVGVGDHIEIWDIDKWNEQMDEYLLSEDAEEKIEDLADYMAGLGV